jgi:hypothetical protein
MAWVAATIAVIAPTIVTRDVLQPLTEPKQQLAPAVQHITVWSGELQARACSRNGRHAQPHHSLPQPAATCSLSDCVLSAWHCIIII